MSLPLTTRNVQSQRRKEKKILKILIRLLFDSFCCCCCCCCCCCSCCCCFKALFWHSLLWIHPRPSNGIFIPWDKTSFSEKKLQTNSNEKSVSCHCFPSSLFWMQTWLSQGAFALTSNLWVFFFTLHCVSLLRGNLNNTWHFLPLYWPLPPCDIFIFKKQLFRLKGFECEKKTKSV